MKQIITTDKAPKPAGPYSQAVVAGDMVFVAGQVPRHPETGKVPETVEEQTRQVMSNIKAILEAAGCEMRQIVRTDVFLSDMKYFSNMNSVYMTFFEGDYPVRTTVGVQLIGFDVEISCVAHL